MKKIVVCGDSYMAPVVDPAGSHFSELLSKIFNAELLIYSRGGMSNAGICIQIEDAIRENPDLILVNTTFADRVEFSIQNKLDQEFHVTDIVYAHQEAASSYQPWLNQNPTMIVDTIQGLLSLPESPKRWHNLYKDVPEFEEKILALRQYLIHLYDHKWKRQIDIWCMYSALHKLEQSGIPYLVVLDSLGVQECSWLTKKNYITHKISQYYKGIDPNFWKTDKDPGYHSSPEIQKNICQEILKHLHEWKLIK